MHKASFLHVTSALILLTGCTRPSADEKLVGAWEMDAGLAKADVTYSKDHSFVASVQGLVSGSTTGTWHVEGDQLVTAVKTCTLRKENEGKEFRETIVKLGEDVLVTKESEEKITTYKRLK